MTIGDKSTLYKIKKVIGDFANWVTVPYDSSDENSLMAYTMTGYYHVHGASFIYPDKADPITLTSNAASWNDTGTLVEIIPAEAIKKDFDLHWASLWDISNQLYGVIDFYAGEIGSVVKIGSVDVGRTANFSREAAMPLQIPQQAANTRISARFSDSTTSAQTVKVRVYGHVYGTSL